MHDKKRHIFIFLFLNIFYLYILNVSSIIVVEIQLPERIEELYGKL